MRGKLEPNFINRFGGCSFELEICYLPHLGPQLPETFNTPTKSILKKGPLNFNTPAKSNNANSSPASALNNRDGKNENLNNSNKVFNGPFVGIRRKRLKGDSWCYKKVCEQVLALTATEFKNVTESSV